ncbi:MAG: siphovirus Gp157 family protein [Spirochaetes bacterium]|nr:MAG: siphovirus Gp157 family protein [Spirochaetota bacterium]
MKPLYELTNEYLSLYNNHEDDCETNFLDTIDKIEDDFDSKAINIASLIKNLKSDLVSFDTAIKSMTERKNAVSKKIDYLCEYLKNNMERIDKKEIKSSIHEIKILSNPASVNIVNCEIIPDEYIKHTEVVKPDLVKIKNDLKLGVVIDGVELKNETRVVIK